jgi:hypothetical protein
MAKVATITIDHTKVAADLTDFPVLVICDDDAGWAELYNVATEGGGDLRFFKAGGSTELPREIVSFSVSGETGEIHVKYSGTLSSSTDTVIEVYADGSSSDYAATDTYGRNNVWSDYLVVYHMNDASSTTVNDSTGSFNLAKHSANNPEETSGSIGVAQSFATTDSVLYTAKSSTINTTGAKTVQMWLKLSNTNNQSIFFGISSGISSGAFDGLIQLVSGVVRFQQWTGLNRLVTLVSSPGTGTWWMLHGTYDGTTMRGYKDGSSTGSTTSSSSYNHGSDATIQFKDNLNTNNGYFLADECRYSKQALSANWITTEYNNQSSPSTFYTVDAEGGGGSSGPATMKTWNGVAIANIKTINSTPIANVKTYNGLT